MRLTTRVLVGAAALLGVNIIVMALIVAAQLGGRLRDQAVDALTREARLVAARWVRGTDPHELAVRDGNALGHRVTIISPGGTVLGDTDSERAALAALPNQADRPEVIAARAGDIGISTSVTRGENALFVAVAASNGTVRVAMPLAELEQRIVAAERAVIGAGAAALLIALVVAGALARRIVNPVVELSEAARAIAAGDLTRRAPIDAPGELGELSLALGDLSAQLAARDAARSANEALLVQLIDALNEGIVGVDARRSVVRINETARQLLEVAVPLPFSADILPRNVALGTALDGALAGRVTEGVETQIGGHTLAIAARPLGGGGAVLALLDLTRLRRLEAVRRDFVANVSHELRTPLTVIAGFAETLTHADLPAAEQARFAERIVQNTRRMQRLVDDLLDLSRIESGGWVPTPEDVDLLAAATDAFGECRTAADAKGLALETAIAEEASHVQADPTAMRQVMRNLVENAVRHTARGTVTIFSRRTPAGATEFGVRDTGAGIAAEHLSRVFERFYRADPARSRDEGGTGLGLAIVRHLVEAHDGTVRIESRLGEGTVVTVALPGSA